MDRGRHAHPGPGPVGGTSSRNYRFSAHVQVIVDADTRLVVVAAHPVPGTTADAKAWCDSGLAGHCQGVTVLGDGAYINTGLVVLHRKRPGRPLLKGEEEDKASTARSARGSNMSSAG